MNIAHIQGVGRNVIQILKQCSNGWKNEDFADAVLFAYLTGRGYKAARQHHVRLYGSTKPQRIDFRLGGSNPVVMELAVRFHGGNGALSATANDAELQKLCRVSRAQAKLRALLLLDLAPKPLKKEFVKRRYDQLHAGPGRFERSSVRVIYVHSQNTFHFSWSPFKS